MLLHAARLTLRYQGRPLRVLLTRPAGQAEETAELVRQAGGEPLVFPCLRPGPPSDAQPLHAALALLRTQGFDGLALTSAHAVAQVLEALQQMPASELVVAAVGPRTAAALQQAGIAAVTCPEEGEESTGEALAQVLAAVFARRGGLLGARILLPQAEAARPELAQALVQLGAQVTTVAAYQMRPAAAEELVGMVEALTTGGVDLVPLGSPRTVETVLSVCSAEVLGQAVVGAIGKTTAAALASAGVRVDVVAAQATFSVLLRQLYEAFVLRQLAAAPAVTDAQPMPESAPLRVAESGLATPASTATD
jgi:uroporphyrinogen-III synthase